ncbi:uncharacterized protein LOC125674406 [Ostrea edulis]|uniref:uncharacterized protein LOC125674406 n=1 Tax=Ostrea edulis TaxID=37623 RepID=UPI0024AF32F4|nr:uncharacterized protein LOC125674406 [Ostrea edulis]XP_048767512.2 uncharacterized protein LOC125674406 [Ostrea edulis]XP_048767513.2 uncharacterized protein LOC125674406 [Ostrea edulis]XP_048767514.2 uncharacterized protein LOC125674406 [Ostrea edulis]
MDEASTCLRLHIVLAVVGGLFLVIAMVALLWKLRQWRVSRRGVLKRCSVRYNTISEENGTNTYQAAQEERSISGCEIYGRQDEILTYDQRKRFGLINVHKGTQTPLETMLYSNYPRLISTIDEAFRRRVETRDLYSPRGEKINTDYDYPFVHQEISRSISGWTSKYENAVLRNRQSNSSGNSKLSCRRRRLSSPCSNQMDNISYINSQLFTASSCPLGEDALSSESQTCSDADSDTGSSDYDSDPPKILLDKKLIAYVKKLERNHTVYIEKYKTRRGSHKKCSKSVSLELPVFDHRRRANTGVLKLLDRKRTKVRKTCSIPVNIETVRKPCRHNQNPKPCQHHQAHKPCRHNQNPKPCQHHQAPKPCHCNQNPKPCLSEENYLKILP